MASWLTNLTTSNYLKPTYVNGFLDISGGDTINRNGKLILYGGDASFNKNLSIGKDASFNGNVYIKGVSTYDGDVNINKDLIIYGNLNIMQESRTILNTYALNIFSISEDVSLNGSISFNSTGSNNTLLNFINDAFPQNKVFLNTNLVADSFNLITSSGDNGFFMGDSPDSAENGFILAPYSASMSGLKITNTGNVCIGKKTADYALDVSGDIAINNNIFIGTDASINGNLSIGMDVSLNGNIYVNTLNSNTIVANEYNFTSDYRIKTFTKPLDDSFHVDNLNPLYYLNTVSNKLDIGFLAHEVQEEFPFLVSGKKDGKDLQTINYIGLIGILVKEIKDLKSQMNSLRGGGTPTPSEPPAP